MTSKEKIKWLSRYKHICGRIMCKLDEKAMWMAKATKVTPTLSDMPKSNSQENKIEFAAEKMDEIDQQINEELQSLIKERGEIEEAINSVPNEKYREILERRYIRGQYWEQIAVDMHYDYRWVLRLHGKALLMVNTPLKDT